MFTWLTAWVPVAYMIVHAHVHVYILDTCTCTTYACQQVAEMTVKRNAVIVDSHETKAVSKCMQAQTARDVMKRDYDDTTPPRCCYNVWENREM